MVFLHFNGHSKAMSSTLRAIWRRFTGSPGSLRSQLIHGTLGTSGIGIAKRLLQLATAVLLAHILGTEGYGIYAYASALVLLIAVPAHLGLPQLVVREVSAHLERRDWNLLRGLLRRSDQLSLIFTILVVAVAALLGWLLSGRIESLEWETFAWAIALIPMGTIIALRSAALRGFHYAALGQLPDGLIRPLAFLILIAACYWLLGSLRPDGAMMLAVAAAGFALVASMSFLSRVRPTPLLSAIPRFETRSWLYNVLPFSLLAGIQVINNHIDIVVLGLFATSAEVGIYRIASVGATLVALPLFSANVALAPKIVSLYTKGDHTQMQRMLTASTRYMLMFAIPLAACLTLFGSQILAVTFGKSFSDGAVPLAILAVGQLINVGFGSVGLFLNMTGYETETVKVLALAALVNVALNLFLIPIFGMLGAALATTVTIIFWNAWLAIIVFHRLKLRTGAMRL